MGGTPQSLAQLGRNAKEDVLKSLMEKLEGRACTLAANLKLDAHQKVDVGVPQTSGMLWTRLV